ncbi:MAG: HAMP domain-containing histidine kinase [Erysipelotrichales bacterium]|nr:HAMP domain-containing histidine kinase [Erysipelotrichales bacterium]
MSNQPTKKPRSIRRWLDNMTLGQQLISIISVMFISLGVFYIVYLRANINAITLNESYTLLERFQNQLIREYEKDPGMLLENTWTDPDISHLIFRDEEPYLYLGIYEPTDNYRQLYDLAVEVTSEDHRGVFKVGEESCHYVWKAADDHTDVLTFHSARTSTELYSSIVNNISNISSLVFLTILVVMVYWVMTLIHPLNQIKNYLDKVRKGEDAALKITRADEIGDVAEAVMSMQEEIKHQEAVKEEMIHNISHDLKTPIATIKSYAESIKDGIYPYGSLDSSVDVIIENADRLEAKVHSLLFLNRLDYLLSSSERQMNSIDMNAIADQVIRSLSAIRPEIEIHYQGEPTVFKGEEESWRILMENLLDNALRYAEKSVWIELKPGYLCVGNDGPSIPPEQMKNLFKPFEKGINGKFGLGLSICSKVAEAYGYTIQAKNIPGGVNFTVRDKTPILDDKERKKKSRARQTRQKDAKKVEKK